MALNFPDSPSLNDLYTDPTTGFTYQWNGEVWKSAVLTNPETIKELGDISSSFDGIETEFALSVSGVAVTPVNAQQLIINLGGVIQDAGNDYTVSGSNITFTTPPASGLSFTGLFVGSAISLNSLSTYSVEPEDLTTGGPSWNTSGDVAISGVATVSNTGSATTALYVDGGARIAGILTVGSSSVRIDGDNNTINVGTGLTINSSGITAGFITATSFYGDGSNLDNVGLGSTSSINTTGIITAAYFYGSGIGITNAGPLGRISPITYSPGIGETNVGLSTNIVITFNKSLVASAGTITLRTDSDTGTIIESFDVTSSAQLSISGGVLTIDPTDNLSGLTTYFVVVPEGCYKDKLNSSSNAGITTYSFTTQQLNYELWLWGWNGSGILAQGDDSPVHRSSPIQIPGTQWVYDSFYLVYRQGRATKTDGTLWGWGQNSYGTLGQNERTDYSSPIQIPGTQWDTIGGGNHFISATKTDGTLWTWGFNYAGMLGQNDQIRYSSPVQIPGTQWARSFPNGYTGYYGIASKTDGTLWTWGDNGYGQLGQNDKIYRSSPVQIPGTYWNTTSNYTITGDGYGFRALKTDGTLWSWGYGASGRLGTNNVISYSSPTQIPGTQWSKVSAVLTTMATKTDGTLWGWGNGADGELAQNDRIGHSSPIQIPGTQWDIPHGGYFVAGGTKTDGTLWMWGSNDYGQLGQNNLTKYSSPVQVPGIQWYSHMTGRVYVTGAIKQVAP